MAAEGGKRQEAPVFDPEDAGFALGNVRERLGGAGGGDQVLEVRGPPVAVVQGGERGAALAGAPDVGGEHGVSLGREQLHDGVESVPPGGSRGSPHVHQQRGDIALREQDGPIEEGLHGDAVVALDLDALGPGERAHVNLGEERVGNPRPAPGHRIRPHIARERRRFVEREEPGPVLAPPEFCGHSRAPGHHPDAAFHAPPAFGVAPELCPVDSSAAVVRRDPGELQLSGRAARRPKAGLGEIVIRLDQGIGGRSVSRGEEQGVEPPIEHPVGTSAGSALDPARPREARAVGRPAGHAAHRAGLAGGDDDRLRKLCCSRTDRQDRETSSSARSEAVGEAGSVRGPDREPLVPEMAGQPLDRPAFGGHDPEVLAGIRFRSLTGLAASEKGDPLAGGVHRQRACRELRRRQRFRSLTEAETKQASRLGIAAPRPPARDEDDVHRVSQESRRGVPPPTLGQHPGPGAGGSQEQRGSIPDRGGQHDAAPVRGDAVTERSRQAEGGAERQGLIRLDDRGRLRAGGACRQQAEKAEQEPGAPHRESVIRRRQPAPRLPVGRDNPGVFLPSLPFRRRPNRGPLSIPEP